MLKVQEIRELIRLIDSSSISELIYEEKDCKIKLRKNSVVSNNQVVQEVAPAQAPEKVAPVAPVVEKVETPKVETAQPTVAKEESKKTSANVEDENLHKIVSPMVGTFYAAPSPEDPPYVQVGDQVNPDSIVCIVEAMKLFNEIEAEVKGEIVEVLVENGQLVEYGQPLFLVKAE